MVQIDLSSVVDQKNGWKWKQCRFRKVTSIFNSFPNNKIIDWSKFKAFADDKINETLKFLLGREDNIVGNGENSG